MLSDPVYSRPAALQDGDLGSGHLRRRRTRAGIWDVVYYRDRPAALAGLSELRLPVLDDDGTVLVWKVP